MPLQSGSDTVLKAMRRAYRRDRYLAILDNVRRAIPHAAITTDIIVGFPGETEADFADTLDVVRQARFASAFTFQLLDPPGHARPRRWTARFPRTSCRTATSASSRLSRRSRRRRTRASTARPWRSWWPRGRAARTPRRTACRAGRGTTASCTSPRTAPRRGLATSSPRRSPSTAPHYLIADGEPLSGPPHPGGRRLGGAPARRGGRARPPRRRHPAPVLLGMPTRR